MHSFRYLMLASFLVLSACAQFADGAAGRMIPASQTDAIRLQQLDAVNAIRQERGLTTLQYSAALNAAAATHARDISVQRRAWNFGSDGSSPQSRAERAGYPGFVRGENISETFEQGMAVLQSWLDDPGAQQAILDPKARMIGLSWFQEPNGKLWWVQMFGD